MRSNVATKLAPVFLFHSVADEPPPGIAGFAVGKSAFARQLDLIADAERVSLTFSEFASRLDSEVPVGDACCITFDDGWSDNLEAARQIADRGLKGTFFITSEYIGRPGMLSRSAIREMVELPGIEIGAHSRTHRRLDELTTVAARDEIQQSKLRTEELLDHEVACFAYPHGSFDMNVRESVIDCGFTSAAAVKNALSHDEDDRFGVARITMTPRIDLHKFGMLLDGEGAPRAWQGERVRTLGYRKFRRLVRKVVDAYA